MKKQQKEQLIQAGNIVLVIIGQIAYGILWFIVTFLKHFIRGVGIFIAAMLIRRR